MRRRAAKIDRNQPEIVSALRAAGCRVQSLASCGAGVPDLLVGHGRTLFLLEVKDGSLVPSARQLTPEQVLWHQHWKGYPIKVVNSVDEALLAVGVL